MKILRWMAVTFSLYSRIPMPRFTWEEDDMAHSLMFFPLVGAVIGALIWVINVPSFMSEIPMAVKVMLTILAPILVTGGFHLDGFMDTEDALRSYADKDRKLEILKDSHSGAFAVLGCVIYFLCYYVLSLELCDYFLGEDSSRRFVNFFVRFMNFLPFCFVFVLSRLLSAFAVAVFPVAKNSGLVHTFSTMSARRFTAVWCASWFILICAAMILLFGKSDLFVILPCILVFVFYYLMAKKNFGGITGDTAGWFVQVCEIVSLASFVILNQIL